jgi:exo-beta-1,3-glucanase (GH17 family)
VVGLSVGNEMVFAKRRTAAELTLRVAALRLRAPAIPLATTEPFHIFYSDAERGLLGEVDFLLANVHPVFQPWFRAAPDANAAKFVVSVVAELAERYCGAILVKETGVPTAPASAGFSAARQASFYRELRHAFPPSPTRAFAYFTAFDAPWRVADEQASPGFHPEEAYWGLYTEARVPKLAVADIPPLPDARVR